MVCPVSAASSQDGGQECGEGFASWVNEELRITVCADLCASQAMTTQRGERVDLRFQDAVETDLTSEIPSWSIAIGATERTRPQPWSGIDYRLRAIAICLTVPLLVHVDRHFHLDDALIYARYAKNALQGHGLVFNIGEPVNALTSILETWLLLGLSWVLHGKILLAQEILGASCLIASALVAEGIVPLAGILIATSSYYYFCLGMETCLFLLLLVLCMKAYLADKLDWLPLLCAMTVLARFEGGAMVAVICWRLWRQKRFPRLVAYLPPLLLIAFYLTSNLHYYGAWLPHSATAKFGQGRSGFWGPWPLAFTYLDQAVWLPIFGSQIVAPILFFLVWFAAKDKRLRATNKIVIPFLLFLGSFYILFNIPSYFWYYAPFLYFSYIYAAHLIPRTRTAWFVALVLALDLVNVSVVTIRRLGVENVNYVHLASWLSHYTPKDAKIASTETGTIGWYCDRNIIDMVGLTTPKNATFTAHRDFSSWFAEQPDYVVVHPDNPFPWEKVALSSPNYELVPVHFGPVYVLRKRHPV